MASKDQVNEAAQEAICAFYAVIEVKFPHLTSVDPAPELLEAFESAARELVAGWTAT